MFQVEEVDLSPGVLVQQNDRFRKNSRVIQTLQVSIL